MGPLPARPLSRKQSRHRHRVEKWVLRALLAVAVIWSGYYVYEVILGPNFHEVVPGQVYRSAQPNASHLKEWRREYGIKTVVNLRGEDYPDEHRIVERRTAKEHGMQVVDVRLSAMHLPSTHWLIRLVDVLETEPRPLLIHCRSGADRTGLASAMAAMAIGGQDYETAIDQMAPRYGHIDGDPEHIRGVLYLYEDYCKRNQLGTGGWEQFSHWVRNEYHPAYYLVQIDVPQQLAMSTGQQRPVAVTITNRSDNLLPLADADKQFNLAAFEGTSIEDMPGRSFGPRTRLPRRDLQPGQSLQTTYPLKAPTRPGRYTVRLDVVEERVTFFHRQGSPMGEILLIVTAPASASAPAARADTPAESQPGLPPEPSATSQPSAAGTSRPASAPVHRPR